MLLVGSSYVYIIVGKQIVLLEKLVLVCMKVYQINSGSQVLDSEVVFMILVKLQFEKFDRCLLLVFVIGQVVEYEFIYGVWFIVIYFDGN